MDVQRIHGISLVADVYQEIKEWSNGVVKSMPSDHIPPNSMPDGVNTAFVKMGHAQTVIGTRPGLHTINTTAFSGSPIVHFQHNYSYDSGSAVTEYIATLSNDGTLRYKLEDDTYTAALAVPANFPSPSTLCFTAGDDVVDGAVFNNRLLLFNSAGAKRSLVGQSYVPWGLSAPSSWSVANAATGSSSMPDETYDVALTFYNSTSGGESSRTVESSVSMGGANRRLKVDITPSAAESAQYTHWRIYLRRQTTQALLYQVLLTETVTPSTLTTDGNIPIATTTAYVDLTSAQIAALTTISPNTTENAGPISGCKHVEVFARRVIVADSRKIYWSKQDKADNFRPQDFEPIDTGDGDEITGLCRFSDNLLLIGLNRAVWGLFGDDPQTWVLRPISRTVGVVGSNSFASIGERLAWWAQTIGPVVFDGTNLTRVGLEELGPDAMAADINLLRGQYITAGVDVANDRVLWSVSGTGKSRNDLIFPFNYRLDKFEAAKWDAIDAASLCTGVGDDGAFRLYLGGYAGQTFYFDSLTRNDGVPSGTTIGAFTPTTASISTVTSTGFYTTGSGLVERKVVVTDADNRPVAKRRITSNTSTVLTLDSAITGLALNQTYNFYVGGPDWRFYSKWIDHDQPFLRKRFDRLYLHFGSRSSVSSLTIASEINFDESTQTALSSNTTGTTLWDVAQWDESQWASGGDLKHRIAIHRNAHALRAAIYCFTPGRDLILYKIGLLSRLLSDRYYG